MQFVKLVVLLVLAAILLVVAMVIFHFSPRFSVTPQVVISNFEECAAAGNAVMPARLGESYPRQCRTADGRHFVEEIGEPIPSDGMMFNGCAVAGCSQQLCVSAEEAPTIMTTCEFKDEYMCYAEASCEPQSDGKCGWTQTEELKQCLANPPEVTPEVQ